MLTGRGEMSWHRVARGKANAGINERRRRASLALGCLILAVSAVSFAAFVGPERHTRTAAAPVIAGHSAATLSGAPSRASRPTTATGALDSASIEGNLGADVAGLQGTYGIAVIDLTSGASYGLNTGVTFRAASVNKLPILIELYQRAASGNLNLDQEMTVSPADIQHYGTGLIQDDSSPRTYTLRELGAAMIETSDNTAAFVLERFLGQDNIQATVERSGLKQTSMADNATSPADTATLLAGLYRERLLSPEATQVAMTLLEHTVFTDRLVSGVPAGIAVAHKIGTDTGVFNDAGIVLLQGRPYVIAVFSQNADEHEAGQALPRISRDVYQFQSSLPSGAAPSSSAP
jgi:beta-lactamase class A